MACSPGPKRPHRFDALACQRKKKPTLNKQQIQLRIRSTHVLPVAILMIVLRFSTVRVGHYLSLTHTKEKKTSSSGDKEEATVFPHKRKKNATEEDRTDVLEYDIYEEVFGSPCTPSLYWLLWVSAPTSPLP